MSPSRGSSDDEAMGAAILSDLMTQILIPVCAVVGIAFSLLQWMIVSRVKVSTEKQSPAAKDKNGFTDSLIEEEEGINDHSVVQKCAEIQNAISEGATSFLYTEYQYVGIFMVAFAVLIFLFLGSVEGFSTKSFGLTLLLIYLMSQGQHPSFILNISMLGFSWLLLRS